MSEFISTNLYQVCDNCGARHPEEKSCVKFWQNYSMKQMDELATTKQRLEEALKVIEFYHDNTPDDLHCDIIANIATDKRAREYLAKLSTKLDKNDGKE